MREKQFSDNELDEKEIHHRYVACKYIIYKCQLEKAYIGPQSTAKRQITIANNQTMKETNSLSALSAVSESSSVFSLICENSNGRWKN